jgi:flagellar biosynthesis/type III secretory pathway chaperone
MSAVAPILEEVLDVTQRLTTLLEREVELLKSLKPQEIRELQKPKTEMSATYERLIRQLREKAPSLANVDPKLKERVRQATVRFQIALADNERSIRAVKTVSERLMRAVVAAVAERKSGTPAYSRAGLAAGGAATAKSVSFAVNRQL